MQEENALSFYERITQGTEKYKEISLEHETGATLNNVRMYAIDKQTLAGVIERLPEEMFQAVEGAEDAEDAEEELEQEGGNMSAVTEDTVNAFEDLCAESLDHEELTDIQMRHIIDELSFETLFELGTEIINMSVEDTGKIEGFHELG
jgi:hypothetical protein